MKCMCTHIRDMHTYMCLVCTTHRHVSTHGHVCEHTHMHMHTRVPIGARAHTQDLCRCICVHTYTHEPTGTCTRVQTHMQTLVCTPTCACTRVPTVHVHSCKRACRHTCAYPPCTHAHTVLHNTVCHVCTHMDTCADGSGPRARSAQPPRPLRGFPVISYRVCVCFLLML